MTTDDPYIIQVSQPDNDAGRFRVRLSFASELLFDVDYEGRNYDNTLIDLCRVIPHLLLYDADYNEGGPAATRPEDRAEIRRFFVHYGQLPERFKECFL